MICEVPTNMTIGALEYALGGLASRADVRADNVANMNTPGFRASGVSFESALADALRENDLSAVPDPVVGAKPGVADPQGNTVSLETEMLEGIKDNLAFETFINSFNSRVTITRTAIRG